MSSGDEKLLNDLNKASSPEEARQLILNQIVPECRQVGKSFFECVENQISNLYPKDVKYEELEKKVSDFIVPDCMKRYNLEECLSKFDDKH